MRQWKESGDDQTAMTEDAVLFVEQGGTIWYSLEEIQGAITRRYCPDKPARVFRVKSWSSRTRLGLYPPTF